MEGRPEFCFDADDPRFYEPGNFQHDGTEEEPRECIDGRVDSGEEVPIMLHKIFDLAFLRLCFYDEESEREENYDEWIEEVEVVVEDDCYIITITVLVAVVIDSVEERVIGIHSLEVPRNENNRRLLVLNDYVYVYPEQREYDDKDSIILKVDYNDSEPRPEIVLR